MPARPWQNRCPLGVTFVLLFAALSVSPVLTHFALGQSTSVGIYTDAAALDCSIIDAAPATISAYVVVRPGPGESVTGVQFSAPKPACFTGVYLSDVTAPGTLMLGNSQTGVSVSLFECSGVPTHVLTIQYFGYGTTPTCCQYPVIADPQETTVLAVDCDYSTLAVVGNVSRFNVDATCSCTGGSPPDPAYLPMPADGAVDVSVFASLAWDASDDDGDVAEFDVYLGTDPDPPLVASGLASGTYQPEQLSEFAQYYWRVVVRDELGLETSGPVWTFTTRGVNTPPVAPFNPFPSDGAVEVRLGPDLRWYCSDTDGDSLSYDVYYGTTFPPPLVVADYPYTAYSTQGAPPNTQCYWQIVAHDATSQVAGPVWSYTTRVSNLSPSPPSSPVPANGATNVSVLETCRWVIKPDVEQDPLTFDVYFGTTNPPPLVAQLILPIYDPGLLDFMTVYYWRVIARDPGMLTSTGGVWSFTTGLAGDSDGDGIVELADAQCALHEFLFGPSCAGNGGRHAASVVDCSAALTPRDARCIHKFVADGSCSFCTQASLEPVVFTGSPVVEASEVHQELDTLVVTLSVSGVPSLEAFGMDVVPMTEGVDLVRASRTTATGAFVVGGSSARIGGYSLTGVPASSATDFITLRFTIPVGHSEILLNAPVDDLGGADDVVVTWDGVPLPVLFARFTARAAVAGVEVNWELAGDEVASRYTLLRSSAAAPTPRVIAGGSLTGGNGSYLDASAEPGVTYRYEMLVQTGDGNEFRSPVATATMADVALALGQNHPNPFNPTTVIPYVLDNGATPVGVRITILDVAGRVVRTLVDEPQTGGAHEVVWNGMDDRATPVSSGVYFCLLDVGTRRLTRKLVMLK